MRLVDDAWPLLAMVKSVVEEIFETAKAYCVARVDDPATERRAHGVVVLIPILPVYLAAVNRVEIPPSERMKSELLYERSTC
jgi:hypothetical protein